VVQTEEAHLVDIFVAEEDFFRAEVGVHDVALMEKLSKVEYF